MPIYEKQRRAFLWKTRDGHEILTSDMTDQHLINAFKLLLHRQAEISRGISIHLSCPPPDDTMAEMCAEQEFDALCDKQVMIEEVIDVFREELRYRGLR